MSDFMTDPEVKALVESLRGEFRRLIEINVLLVQSIENICVSCEEVSNNDEVSDDVKKLSKLVTRDCINAIEAAKLLTINYGVAQ